MINFLFEKTPLFFMTQSFWRDEAFSYSVAARNLGDMLEIVARDFNPPLYYAILHFWIKFFGSSEVGMRSLSLIFFSINIYAVYYLITRILKIKTQRKYIYLSLFALNPLLLYFAFEARMYSFFALVSTLSFYFFWQRADKKLFLVNVVGLYTHYFFIFVIFTQIFYTFFFERKNLSDRLKNYFLSFLFFLPWVLRTFPTLLVKTSETWIKKANPVDLILAPGYLFTGYEGKYYLYYQSGIFLISIFFLFLILLALKKRAIKNDKLLFFLLSWSFLFYFLIIVISFIKPIFVPRYLIFSAVGFNLLIFYLLERLNKNTRLISLILIFFIIFQYTWVQVKYRRKADLRFKMKMIKSIARDRDLVYLRDPLSYFVASYYHDENKVYLYRDVNQTLPYFIGMALIPREKIILDLPSFPRKAFILDRDFNYEIKSKL